jgi:hypothetical protein
MAQTRQNAWAVVLGWFIANLLAVGLIGLIPYLHLAVPTIPGGMIVSSLLIGLPIGIAQWLAIRRIAPISLAWIVSVSIALPLGLATLNSTMLFGVFSSFGDESVIGLTLGYWVVGLFTGLIQWLFLRGLFAKSLLWPLGSSVGLGLGTGLVLVSDLINQSGVASIVLVVLIYAIVTGSLLEWMPMSLAKERASLPSAA